MSSDYEYIAEESGIVITNYKGSAKDVVIPEEIDGKPVAFIGDNAFGRKGLTSVVFPSTLKGIRESAFERNEIEEVIIPESVSILGYYAFASGSVKRVTIQAKHNLIIEKDAFSGNEIEELVLDGNIIEIRERAFYENKITKVRIPDSVKVIGKEAFSCNKIEKLVLGNSVETIDTWAFKKNMLTEVELPDSFKNLGSSVFDDNKIKLAIIGDDMTNPPYFGKNVRIIKRSALAFETSSTQYAHPDNFKWIVRKDKKGVSITDYLGKEKDVSIPPQINGHPVISVGFHNKKTNYLGHVTIPGSVEEIGSKAFANSGMTSVTIENGVKIINSYAFDNCALTSVTIPDSVTTLEKHAFSRNKLTEVTLSKGLDKISDNAFSKNEIVNIDIPPNITEIGELAFYKNKMKKLIIPFGTKRILRLAFCETRINEVTLPESIEFIGQGAFRNNNLKSVTIPDSNITIQKQAFEFNNIESVRFGKGSISIEDTTFQENLIREVVLPPNVTGTGMSNSKCENSFDFWVKILNPDGTLKNPVKLKPQNPKYVQTKKILVSPGDVIFLNHEGLLFGSMQGKDVCNTSFNVGGVKSFGQNGGLITDRLLINNPSKFIGVVTADGTIYHHPESIKPVMDMLSANNEIPKSGVKLAEIFKEGRVEIQGNIGIVYNKDNVKVGEVRNAPIDDIKILGGALLCVLVNVDPENAPFSHAYNVFDTPLPPYNY
ncbi:MAG: leucine-rich repeat domain-containing protein [Treponema sp.]|nr:leucine-rich repeat domain-containing protein [Treponema sp.]